MENPETKILIKMPFEQFISLSMIFVFLATDFFREQIVYSKLA